MITTAWFLGTEALSDAHALRRKVFIEEQGIKEADEMDGTDAACIHLVAYVEEEPAATGRIMITRDAYLIGRVAVLPHYRGRGLGALVVRMLVRACFTMGGECQIVHAQVSVRGFYEKLGFTVTGDEFEEAGIRHVPMTHQGDIITPCAVCGGQTQSV